MPLKRLESRRRGAAAESGAAPTWEANPQRAQPPRLGRGLSTHKKTKFHSFKRQKFKHAEQRMKNNKKKYPGPETGFICQDWQDAVGNLNTSCRYQTTGTGRAAQAEWLWATDHYSQVQVGTCSCRNIGFISEFHSVCPSYEGNTHGKFLTIKKWMQLKCYVGAKIHCNFYEVFSVWRLRNSKGSSCLQHHLLQSFSKCWQ